MPLFSPNRSDHVLSRVTNGLLKSDSTNIFSELGVNLDLNLKAGDSIWITLQKYPAILGSTTLPALSATSVYNYFSYVSVSGWRNVIDFMIKFVPYTYAWYDTRRTNKKY